MEEKQIEAIMRLFKGYVLNNDKPNVPLSIEDKEMLAQYGLIVTSDYVPDISVFNYAIKMYGKDSKAWNQTFHKSYQTVIDTPIETLVAQQIIHYFTTYGFEDLGVYNKDLVYIPYEQLDTPIIDEDIPVIVVRQLSSSELCERLMKLVTSGIALSKQTIEDIMVLSDYIDEDRVDEIQNREIKIALYEKYNIVPKNNVEFLRYVIYKAIGSTLLIKDDNTIKAIKTLSNEEKVKASNLFYLYTMSAGEGDIGFNKLAEIFLRYKELFLAFKIKSAETNAEKLANRLLNRISKLSKKYHKPLAVSPLDRALLDNLTAIKTEEQFYKYKDKIIKALDNITIFREIRILNALNFNWLRQTNYSLYRIRNGKAFVEEISTVSADIAIIQRDLFSLVNDHLISRLKPKLNGKSVYIPKNVQYVLPTSEKQFVNNVPEGSYVIIPRTTNLVIGIHWENLDSSQVYDSKVDLDLKMSDKTSQFGWDASYKRGNQIVFSGDITDAPKPNGATETFLINRDIENGAYLLTVNNFTQNSADVPYEYIVAEFDDTEFGRNYTVNPNKIKLKLNNVIKKHEGQVVLGMIVINKEELRVYFNDFSIGNQITTRLDNITRGAFEYTLEHQEKQLGLEDLLISCGVSIEYDKPTHTVMEEIGEDENGNKLFKQVEKPVDYDLSLNVITKETIIDLLSEV